MTMDEVSVHASNGSVDQARAILAASEAYDGTPPVSDQALLSVQQGGRELVLFSDARSGSEIDSAQDAAAVGIVGDGELDLVVHPKYRGRGIGAAALQDLIFRAGGTALRAWVHGAHPAADAMLAHAGFAPVRTLYRMALDPTKLPVAAAVPGSYASPEGFSIRPFDPTAEADPALWVRVNAAAFATHPEQGRITEADFALQRAEPWFDPNDLLLLEAPGGERLAGSTWIKTVRTTDAGAPHTETELYAVGVDPAFTGRGLGRVLLEATLARMAEHTPDRVTLYVDGENERAVNMYLAAGFEIDSRSRQWLRGARIGS